MHNLLVGTVCPAQERGVLGKEIERGGVEWRVGNQKGQTHPKQFRDCLYKLPPFPLKIIRKQAERVYANCLCKLFCGYLLPREAFSKKKRDFTKDA